MTEAVFHAPKRRARVYEQFEAPLPVSPCAEDGRDVIVCRAEVICDNVIITNLEHIQHLYSRGYFGKGLFSRSRPEHMISQRWRNAGGRCLPVISASEYEKRLALAREALDLQGLEEESVHDVLQVLSKPVEFEGPRAEAIDATLTDDSGLLDRSEGASGRPRREGNPRFDPLAQLSPPEKPCLEAEPSANHHEYVLVEEGDGNSDADGRKLQCRINPFSILEYLQLSYEEAFFLTYALGCLSVFHNEESLSVAELWRKFRSLQPNFCFSYAVYHYFRSKGWVPKTGIKYGTDFMLYRKGPPFYHAGYSVVVERVEESCSGFSLRPFTWRSLAALSRITGNVSKELMLCFVITPSDLSEDLLSTPQCLRRFTLQEVVLSRWVSSRERSDQDET